MNIQNKLENIIYKEGKLFGATGLSFTIQSPLLNNGKPKTYNVGLQSLEGAPVTNESLFQIGSASKTFLSVVMLQLESEEKISLEDPVSKFFPNEYLLWHEIKIKHLLNMTSGIPNFTNDGTEISIKNIHNLSLEISTEEILNSIQNNALLFTTGSYFYYSNTNYVLAKRIIEHVTQNSLSQEINKRIIEKLNLENTFYINHLPKNEIPINKHNHIMNGYNYYDKVFLGKETINNSLSVASGAGSLVSNSSNLNTFIRSLFSHDCHLLLSPFQIKQMLNFNYYEKEIDSSNTMPQKITDHFIEDGYGLGIYSNALNEFSHSGMTDGFLAEMKYLKEIDTSYVYLMNASNEKQEKELISVIEELLVLLH